jgi:hypothetical protein
MPFDIDEHQFNGLMNPISFIYDRTSCTVS